MYGICISFSCRVRDDGSPKVILQGENRQAWGRLPVLIIRGQRSNRLQAVRGWDVLGVKVGLEGSLLAKGLAALCYRTIVRSCGGC